MNVAHGHVVLRQKSDASTLRVSNLCSSPICDICFNYLDPDESAKQSCPNDRCFSTCHLTCLAGELTEVGQYIPIRGQCPSCRQTILWGELIRKRNGCSGSVILIDDDDNGENSEATQIKRPA